MFKSIKKRTLMLFNAKIYLYISSLIVYSFAVSTYGQFSSQNDYTGFWNDTHSWIDNIVPGTSVLKTDVYCFGEITSLNCLDFNSSNLTIYDTLIINGNLEIKNTANLTIEDGGFLFVFGDFTAKNKVDLVNRGTMVVAGNFEMLGSDNQGSVLNEGEVFIFDTTPTIDEVSGFESIGCTITGKDTVCGYGDFDDFEGHLLYGYYSSLPFSNRTFVDKKNECSLIEITSSGQLCLYDTILFFADMVGYDYRDTIKWDFGEGAVPMEASGHGPHKVTYENPGEKTISVGTNGFVTMENEKTLIFEDIPLDISIINDKDEVQPGLFLDEVCEGSVVEYRTSGSIESNYIWNIPSLEIDTTTEYSINIGWDLSPGEYQISVVEVNASGCLGNEVIDSVLVKACKDFASKNDYQGFWNNNASWVSGNSPGLSVLDKDVYCFGEITSLNCLDFNASNLTIYDTLIINGNLEIKNTANLSIEDGAYLIVFGDFTAKNKVDLVNRGTLVVAGNFEMLGSDNQGSVLNEGEVFIFDTTPTIDEVSGFESIGCTITGIDTVCGYGDFDDFEGHLLYGYYSSLPFSNRTFVDKKNECSLIEITSSGQLCLYDTILFFADMVGYDYRDIIKWDFGEGALPKEAFGHGPHKVTYENPGEKTISVGTNGFVTMENEKTLIIEDIPLEISIINDKDEVQPGLFLDEVCEGSVVEYRTNGSVESFYMWNIPALSVDTTTEYFLNVDWDIAPGEYEILVTEINSSGCLGQKVTETVLVQSCEEQDLFEKDNFAFTPNDDNINDNWRIPGIEDYPMAKIYVFNRKGEPLFKSEGNYQNDWNGTSNGVKLSLGSYYYIIDLSAYSKPEKRGVITIIW